MYRLDCLSSSTASAVMDHRRWFRPAPLTVYGSDDAFQGVAGPDALLALVDAELDAAEDEATRLGDAPLSQAARRRLLHVAAKLPEGIIRSRAIRSEAQTIESGGAILLLDNFPSRRRVVIEVDTKGEGQAKMIDDDVVRCCPLDREPCRENATLQEVLFWLCDG